MTRLEALQALAEKVDAGGASYYPGQDFHLAMGGNKYEFLGRTKGALECDRAFNGSLDAAKALHEAVLSGWDWRIQRRGYAAVWSNPLTLQDAEIEDEPARAWLLAVLKVLIAREQAKGDE